MKKIIKIIGILFGIAVLFFNVSLNKTNSRTNTDLSKLIVTNVADAECWPWNPTTETHGVCVIDQCFFSVPDDKECDPMHW
jgi:hypothetical protein